MRLELSKKDLSRINCVDLLVSYFYKCSLYSFCQKYNYDILFLEIVRQVTMDYNYNRMYSFGVEIDSKIESRYLEVSKKFTYGNDTRSVVERVVSLGVNWVVEDVIVHGSSSVFLLTGCDYARDYLANPITNTPDIRYVGTGESYFVEVCSDFTCFMEKNHRYDLRKLKYYKLEELCLIEKQKILLLFIDVVNKTFYVEWFSSKSYSCHDKYLPNTVSIEWGSNIKFRNLIDLFERCKSLQPNPSLYSNFNEIQKSDKSNSVGYSDEEAYKDEGYWESLYKNEPAFIRCRVPDIDEEVNGYYTEKEDDYDIYDGSYLDTVVLGKYSNRSSYQSNANVSNYGVDDRDKEEYLTNLVKDEVPDDMGYEDILLGELPF